MDNFNSLELRGRRIVLNPVRIVNSSELFRIIDESREHLQKWLPWVDFVRCVDDERHMVEQWLYEMQMRTAIHFCINISDQLVGLASTHQIDWMNQKTSIGYWVKKDMVNKGIATEATAVLMQYLFERLKIHRVYIQAATGNAASNRVIQKLGFNLEGTLKDNERIGDGFVNHNIYGMTTDDFVKIRQNLSRYFNEID
jgi:ribosomal-protein-serine acetyltransferase